MPNKSYRLYPQAIKDLESIYSYSIQEFGSNRTEDYILAIESNFQYLAKATLRKYSIGIMLETSESI